MNLIQLIISGYVESMRIAEIYNFLILSCYHNIEKYSIDLLLIIYVFIIHIVLLLSCDFVVDAASISFLKKENKHLICIGI